MRAIPIEIAQCDTASRLPLIPGVGSERQDLAERRPCHQIVTDCQMCLIPDVVHADVDHVPAVRLSEDARAVDRFAVFTSNHDSHFEGRLQFLVHGAHLRFGNEFLSAQADARGDE